MMKEKLLTIAVPTYNLGNYVRRIVNDISDSGNMGLLEILIVDDGSTDDTFQKCLELSETYPESIRVLTKPNGHYGSAVNLAIANAMGKYFKIVDADDRVNPAGLSGLLDYIQQQRDVDLIMTDYAVEYESGETVECCPEVECDEDGHVDMASLKSLPMHAVAYKTDILVRNKIKLDEGVPYTDVEFVLYPLPYVKNAVYFNQVVYRYQLGREGQSVEAGQMVSGRRKHQSVLMSLIDWFCAQENFLAQSDIAGFSRRRIIEMYEKQVQIALECGNPKEEVKELRRIRGMINGSSLREELNSRWSPFLALSTINFRLIGAASAIYKSIKRCIK